MLNTTAHLHPSITQVKKLVFWSYSVDQNYVRTMRKGRFHILIPSCSCCILFTAHFEQNCFFCSPISHKWLWAWLKAKPRLGRLLWQQRHSLLKGLMFIYNIFKTDFCEKSLIASGKKMLECFLFCLSHDNKCLYWLNEQYAHVFFNFRFSYGYQQDFGMGPGPRPSMMSYEERVRTIYIYT